MKLIYCRECHDVIALRTKLRTCICGRSSGLYTNDRDASIGGPCVAIGIRNDSLLRALRSHDASPRRRPGPALRAFVIPESAAHLTRVPR